MTKKKDEVDIISKQIDRELKPKKNKTQKTGDKQMKAKFITVAKYVVTISLTLGVVYSGWSLYQAGYNQGRSDEQIVRAEIKAEVAKLSKQ